MSSCLCGSPLLLFSYYYPSTSYFLCTFPETRTRREGEAPAEPKKIQTIFQRLGRSLALPEKLRFRFGCGLPRYAFRGQNPSFVVFYSLVRGRARLRHGPYARNRQPIALHYRCLAEHCRLFAKHRRCFAKHYRFFAKNDRLFAKNGQFFAKNRRCFAKHRQFSAKHWKCLAKNYRFFARHWQHSLIRTTPKP
uniref:Uncharacterized protein n=1 Tax=Candidatus Kentrum sp. FM TaxID=2126340 RepID=A0A450VMA6_9GAMM|nr:MAG: hypothetical protein BECKFM1743B_GA0114221_1000712 [Candidatus Kentron sp. FM]